MPFDTTRQLSAPIDMTEKRKFWQIKFSEKWEVFQVEYDSSIIVPCQYFCIIPELGAFVKMAKKIRWKFFEIWCGTKTQLLIFWTILWLPNGQLYILSRNVKWFRIFLKKFFCKNNGSVDYLISPGQKSCALRHLLAYTYTCAVFNQINGSNI